MGIGYDEGGNRTCRVGSLNEETSRKSAVGVMDFEGPNTGKVGMRISDIEWNFAGASPVVRSVIIEVVKGFHTPGIRLSR